MENSTFAVFSKALKINTIYTITKITQENLQGLDSLKVAFSPSRGGRFYESGWRFFTLAAFISNSNTS